MKTSSVPGGASGIGIDCSLNWPELSHFTGPCIRPGGFALTERALEACCLPPGSVVVDIGCGAGGTLECLEQTRIYHPVGLDCSDVLLRDAVHHTVSSKLARGRAENLPFRSRVFDALLCECVLSILTDKATSLSEFARVLKEGGFLIVSDVFVRNSGEGQTQVWRQRPQNEGPLVKDELLEFLETLGFSVLLWEEHRRAFKEFVARMILAGEGLQGPWKCTQIPQCGPTARKAISYFLLVARKERNVLQRIALQKGA